MKLLDISDIFSGRPPQRAEPGQVATVLPVLAMRDVGTRLTPLQDLESLDLAGPPDPQRRLQLDDVVITSRGRLRAAVAMSDHVGVVVGPNLIVIRLRREFPPILLAAYLRSPFIEDLLLTSTGSAATPGVSIDALRALSLREISSDRAALLSSLVEEADAYRREIEEGAKGLSDAATAAVYVSLQPLGRP